MGMHKGVLKQIELQKKKVYQNLLPDTCQFFPAIGDNFIISGSGVLISDEPEAREWVNDKGQTVTNIPCRMASEKASIPDKLPAQVTIVDRYILEVPLSLREIVEQTDRIVVNGRKYEIKRFSDQSAWDVTLEMTVVEISAEIDHA